MTRMNPPIIELDGVSKRFVKPLDAAEKVANLFGAGLSDEVVRAVDDVSLAIGEGEVVGLVGESGCGKSTLGRIVAGILPRARACALQRPRAPPFGADAARRNSPCRWCSRTRWPRSIRAAASSRSSARRRSSTASSPRASVEAYVAGMMEQVGLDPATRRRYPHQFSGGQRAAHRHRPGARGAAAVLVCDEATAALDVSIQAQVLNLFMRLRQELGLTYLFVSHDLGVVEHIADRVAVMYLGRIVELAPTEASSPRRTIPTRRRFSTRCRGSTHASGASRPSRARSPPRCDRRPAAISTRAARFAFARCRGDRPALRRSRRAASPPVT